MQWHAAQQETAVSEIEMRNMKFSVPLRLGKSLGPLLLSEDAHSGQRQARLNERSEVRA